MATQRNPLPHISGRDPSALTTIICGRRVGASRGYHQKHAVGADSEVAVAQSLDHPGAKAARRSSMTMKSLPSPSYFSNATRATLQSYRLVAMLPMLVWAGRHPHLGAGSIFE